MNFFYQPLLSYLLLPTTTMPKKFDEIEGRVQEALRAYHDRGKPKMTTLAREFDIPYQRLKRRVRGRKSRSEHPGPNKA